MAENSVGNDNNNSPSPAAGKDRSSSDAVKDSGAASVKDTSSSKDTSSAASTKQASIATASNSGTDLILDRIKVASRSISDDELILARASQRKRQNQQIIIYLIVSGIIFLAFLLGVWQFSCIWIFGLVVLTFIIWRSKVFSLTEQYIREKEILIHRKRALRQNETAEWFNFIINRWWVFSDVAISQNIKRNLDPLLSEIKPSFLESLEVESFTFGDRTPFIKSIHVYECADGVSGSKNTMSWMNVNQPPVGLQMAPQFQIVVEAQVELHSDEFAMKWHAKLAGKWIGMSLDLVVEKLSLSGNMQMNIRLDMDVPFPHVSSATVCFLEKPQVWFDLRLLKQVQIMEIPFLKLWIHHFVMNGLCDALVDPGKIEIDLKPTSSAPSNYVQDKAQPKKPLAQGVVTISVNGEYKVADKEKKDKSVSSNQSPMELIDDMRYCVVCLGEQENPSLPTSGTVPWSHMASFLVHDVKNDVIKVQLKSKFLLTNKTLTELELPLTNYPFDQKQSFDIKPYEKKLEKSHSGEIVKIQGTIKYTALPDIAKAIDQGISTSFKPPQTESGVLYICVHGASNLLGLDSDGLSDPYCMVYNGGKKVASTHYVPRTRNPKWEVSSQFLVEDITKSVLSFVVYDWDGTSISDDDFLGSAHIVMSMENPVRIRKNLKLDSNLISDNDVGKNGTICVTIIFTSISSFAKKPVARNPSNSIPVAPVRRKESMKKPSIPGGSGIVEISIIQATNLVAKDRNGFSDPYCEVCINNKRKFVTAIKNKTLNPVWDEQATIEMPKPNELLEIRVWDHDMVGRNDFLGSLSFSVDDLKSYSSNVQHDGWFKLTKIDSGSIQLRFKVFSDEGINPEPVALETKTVPNKKQKNISNGELPTYTETAHVALNVELPREPSTVLRAKARSMTDEESDCSVSVFSSSQTDEANTSPSRAGKDGSTSQKLSRKGLPGESGVIRRTTSELACNLFDKKLINGNVDLEEMSRSSTAIGVSRTVSEYVGIHGEILSVTGLSNTSSHMYCKVKIASSLEEKQRRSGYVVVKSPSFIPTKLVNLDLKFEIDHANNQSMLVFDIKSGHYSHVAMHGFKLCELLGDEAPFDKNQTRWLELENGVKIQVRISFERIQTAQSSLSSRRSGSFLGGLRPNILKKIKEH